MRLAIIGMVLCFVMMTSVFAVSCETGGYVFKCPAKVAQDVKLAPNKAISACFLEVTSNPIQTPQKASILSCERGIVVLKGGRPYITTEVYRC